MSRFAAACLTPILIWKTVNWAGVTVRYFLLRVSPRRGWRPVSRFMTNTCQKTGIDWHQNRPPVCLRKGGHFILFIQLLKHNTAKQIGTNPLYWNINEQNWKRAQKSQYHKTRNTPIRRNFFTYSNRVCSHYTSLSISIFLRQYHSCIFKVDGHLIGTSAHFSKCNRALWDGWDITFYTYLHTLWSICIVAILRERWQGNEKFSQ